jgi:hypothetical protein
VAQFGEQRCASSERMRSRYLRAMHIEIQRRRICLMHGQEHCEAEDEEGELVHGNLATESFRIDAEFAETYAAISRI